eukprot:172878_1
MGNESSTPGDKSITNYGNLDSLKSYETLLSFGFDHTLSFEAAYKFKGDVNKAIEYITNQQNNLVNNDFKNNQASDMWIKTTVSEKSTNITHDKNIFTNHQCEESNILMCPALQKLNVILGSFNKQNTYGDVSIKQIFANKNYTITELLNDFNHIKYDHNA